ncbi:MAG: J domain-containing protein [bacterium]
MINNLRILNLNRGASPEEIKCAYRELVKKWHPDLFYQDCELRQRAETKLKQINKAYKQLQENNFSEIINNKSEDTPKRKPRKYEQKPTYILKVLNFIQENVYIKRLMHVLGYSLLVGSLFSISFLAVMLLWLLSVIIAIIIL